MVENFLDKLIRTVYRKIQMNNREIKFRIWDTFTKKMVATGYHVVGEVTVFSLIDQWAKEYRNPKSEHSLDRYNDFIEMQYTGLKDKEGKEIYEGDFVKASGNGRVYQVKFGTYKSSFSEHEDDFEHGFFIENENYPESSAGVETYATVIGNIFENPELLK